MTQETTMCLLIVLGDSSGLADTHWTVNAFAGRVDGFTLNGMCWICMHAHIHYLYAHVVFFAMKINILSEFVSRDGFAPNVCVMLK